VEADSEATVLYTAQRYVDNLGVQSKPAAMLRLGPLIRCQHLSLGWLSAVATAITASAADTQAGRYSFVMAQQIRPAQQFLRMRILNQELSDFKDGVKRYKDWPDSWLLGPRLYTPQDSVQLTWAVNVS
jgi:hypothetical protein